MRYLLVIVVMISPLLAQDDLRREIAAIAAIPNGVQRLAAFDAKAGLAPGSQEKKATAGKWRVSTDTSPVDDSKTVTAHLAADAPITAGYRKGQPVMVLRYKEGKVDAYIVFDLFLGSESIEATVRFGKEPATQQNWWVSTDHKAAFVMGDAMEFIKKLSQADSFLIRVTPYSESPVTVSFSPAGADAVIEAINAAKSRKQ